MDTVDMLMSLLKSRICMQAPSVPIAVAEQEWRALYALAKKHDLAHVVGAALPPEKAAELSGELTQRLQKAAWAAIYRYEKMHHVQKELYAILEREEIPFVPLKGAVIRSLYPDPWLRTSSDIDVLVHPEDLERVAALLVEQHQYRRDVQGSHDISLYAPGEVHVELHYDLIEDGVVGDVNEILHSVWQNVCLKEESAYHYEMCDELFFFYHIAHMAKHVVHGGCGIRPVLDLWLLEHRMPQNEKRDELLQKGGLLSFANAMRALANAWFSDGERDERTLRLQEYLLHGGVYGTRENRVQIQQSKTGSRLRYACSRIFLPYETIKFHYPILQKHRWLTPFCEVRRWGKLIFRGGAKRSLDELSISARIDKKQAEETAAFLAEIGL